VTAVEALELHGVSWRQLERIAGKALQDAMRARSISLDSDRLQRAHEMFVDLGARWAKRYDARLANGVSFTTSLYRHLYGTPPGAKLIDFLRREHGDERRGTPIHLVPAGDRNDVAASQSVIDEETFEQLAEHISGSLTQRARHTLETIAYEALVLGEERWRIASRHGIDPGEISELLEELGWQLRRAIGERAPWPPVAAAVPLQDLAVSG
jgi:hypothetical protein